MLCTSQYQREQQPALMGNPGFILASVIYETVAVGHLSKSIRGRLDPKSNLEHGGVMPLLSL